MMTIVTWRCRVHHDFISVDGHQKPPLDRASRKKITGHKQIWEAVPQQQSSTDPLRPRCDHGLLRRRGRMPLKLNMKF